MSVAEALVALESLQDDSSVSKNMKVRLQSLIALLQMDGDVNTMLTKALEELDDLSQNTNLQPFVRSQLWNVTSLLESLNARS